MAEYIDKTIKYPHNTDKRKRKGICRQCGNTSDFICSKCRNINQYKERVNEKTYIHRD